MLSPSSLHTRFAALTRALLEHQPLWQPRPFAQQPLPWRVQHPKVAAWLLGLDDAALDQLEAGAPLPDTAPGALRGWWAELANLTELPRLHHTPLRATTPQASGIPGRKWQQVLAFAEVLLPRLRGDEQLLDWCAGKGHLGRSLATLCGRPTQLLEWNPALCEVAPQTDLVQTRCLDVLSPEAASLVTSQTALLGLHACGQLSERLLQVGCARRARLIVSAGCCFHKLADGQDAYRPLSQAGLLQPLPLDRGGLRLCSLDEVVSGRARRRDRRRALAYRLGWQALHQLPQPPGMIPRRQLKARFSDFARQRCNRLDLAQPSPARLARAEADGLAAARRLRALELVRFGFRRGLELWILLDRSLFLLEAGRQVALGRFCERALTPRNLLLVAH